MRESLISEYNKKKVEIRKRLDEFKSVWGEPDTRIFKELCFCICTPQSKAVYCDSAVSSLERNGFLFNGKFKQIRNGLDSVRFANNKARYILMARDLFTVEGSIHIKDKIDADDVSGTREWFVQHVKGIGFKEASHFLRNIGLGKELAILDVHILRNMVKYGVARMVPKSISKKTYLSMENALKRFSETVQIPMDELDLLFWSGETGIIFK